MKTRPPEPARDDVGQDGVDRVHGHVDGVYGGALKAQFGQPAPHGEGHGPEPFPGRAELEPTLRDGPHEDVVVVEVPREERGPVERQADGEREAVGDQQGSRGRGRAHDGPSLATARPPEQRRRRGRGQNRDAGKDEAARLQPVVRRRAREEVAVPEQQQVRPAQSEERAQNPRPPVTSHARRGPH